MRRASGGAGEPQESIAEAPPGSGPSRFGGFVRPPRGQTSESEYFELRLVAVASLVLFILDVVVIVAFPFILGFSPLDSAINVVGAVGLIAVYLLAMRGLRRASSSVLLVTLIAVVWAATLRSAETPSHDVILLANLVHIGLAFALSRRIIGAVAAAGTLVYAVVHGIATEHAAAETLTLVVVFLALVAIGAIGPILRGKERRRATTAELARSTAQADLRGLFDNMTEGVAHCRMLFENGQPVDWQYLRVNHAFGPLTGLQNSVGKRVSDLIPGIRASNPELFELYGRVAHGGAPGKLELRIPALNRWFTVSAHHAGLDEFFAVFDNVTARKEAEQALRESESRMRSLLDNLDEGFVSTDLAANTTMNSVGIARIFGHPRAAYDADPRLWASQLHPDDAQRVLANYADLLGGTPVLDDARIVRPNGEVRWVRVTIHAIKDASGTVVRLDGVIRDMTAERDAEAARSALESKGREVERLADLAKMRMEFIHNAAHDLRTPLTPLKLQLATLRFKGGLDPAQKASLALIDRNVVRFQVLVDDMLDAARLQAGHLKLRLEPVTLGPLVTEAFASFEEPAKLGGLTMEMAAFPDAVVAADPAKVMQVLMNLVSNAVKYSPPGGRVRISIQVTPTQAVVALEDSGLGLSADQIARLFQPFVRVHENQAGVAKGTGLGLYICKGIVEQHGGRIWAESPGPWKGSTFFASWPLASLTLAAIAPMAV